jgi:hypothetical protein
VSFHNSCFDLLSDLAPTETDRPTNKLPTLQNV